MWFSISRRIKYIVSVYKTLNFKRVVNYLKLQFSFCVTKIVGKVWHCGKPYALSIEPSGICNLKCPECPVGANVLNRVGGIMELEIFKKIINESQPYVCWLNLYFQGEPFLNPQLFEMIKETKKHKVFSIISTNGHFLDAENCSKIIDFALPEIIISVDGISDTSYSKYRIGGDLQKVKEGITRLIEKRDKENSNFPFVTIQFLVFKHNENEIADIIRWCKKNSVDRLILKSAQMNDFGAGNVELPTIKKYSRYKRDATGKLIMKKRLLNQCFKQWSSAVFSHNGEMTICCFDKKMEHSIGNITNQTMQQLWKSEKIKNLRNIIYKDKKIIEICNNCPEGRTP